LGERLKCSPEAARSLAKRVRLPRQRANDGKSLVVVDVTEVSHRALPARSPADHPSVTATLKARIEFLEAELAKVEAAATGHRADFERERDRVDNLMSEMLKATLELMTTKESAARIEGELAALHSRRWWRLRRA
jgi:hypothetical protein